MRLRRCLRSLPRSVASIGGLPSIIGGDARPALHASKAGIIFNVNPLVRTDIEPAQQSQVKVIGLHGL